MKKRKKWIAALIIGIFFITGCSSGSTRPVYQAPDASKNGIQIWAWDDTFNAKAAQMAASRYQRQHPDMEIKVTTKEREEILSDVKLMLSSQVYDELPDIIMIEDYDIQDVLQNYRDEFVVLDDVIDYDCYVDYKANLVQYNEIHYGIPFDCGTAALFYRLDIIEKAGFHESDMQNLTWTRYMEIGRQVYEKTGIPMLTLDPTDMPLVRLIMQSCGKWYVTKDGTTADIEENQALKQALEIYQELLQKNLGVSVNGWNEFISAFQHGDVATVISGGWIMSSIRANQEQSGLWRVAQIPKVENNANAVPASNVGGSAWYILKNSKHSEQAKDLMVSMFAQDTDFMDTLVEEIGIIPSMKDLSVLKNYDATDPFFGGQCVTRLLNGFAAMVPVVNYGSKTYEIEKILEAEFQNELSGGDMQQCLSRVQFKAEAVIKQ